MKVAVEHALSQNGILCCCPFPGATRCLLFLSMLVAPFSIGGAVFHRHGDGCGQVIGRDGQNAQPAIEGNLLHQRIDQHNVGRFRRGCPWLWHPWRSLGISWNEFSLRHLGCHTPSDARIGQVTHPAKSVRKVLLIAEYFYGCQARAQNYDDRSG